MRAADPYQAASDYPNLGAFFYKKLQERIYKEVIMAQEEIVVPQKFIDMEHMNKNRKYFAEAKAVCEELGLLPLMKFHNNFDLQLVAQCYATVHFTPGANRYMV